MTKLIFGLLLCLFAVAGCAPIKGPSAPVKPASAAPADSPAAPTRPATSLPLSGEPTLARIEASATLRVGVAINAPWVLHGEQGQLAGYSIDIARRLADSMGWKLELVETSWPNLIRDLRTDRYDVIISGLSITPARARLIQFTAPVGEFDIAAVVNRRKNPKAGVDALARVAHAKIGAHKGELTVDFARSAFPIADLVEVEDEDTAIADVRDGKLDAYVAEAPMPHLLEKIYPVDLRALDAEPIARTAHGFGVRRGDAGLLGVLNAWIVYEQASGWLKARGAYWFEDTGWANGL